MIEMPYDPDDLGRWMNMWNGVRALYDSPSMPVRGLGVSFEGVPQTDKCLFLKTQKGIFMQHPAMYRTNALRKRHQFKVLKNEYIELVKKRGCDICGYDRCKAALEFHHNGDDKGFTIARFQIFALRDLEKLELEISKCRILCSNCHRELHSSDSKTFGKPKKKHITDDDLPLLKMVNS